MLLRSVYADLRKRNEYRARVARLLEGKRAGHVEHVIQVQRQHRVRRAR